METGKKTDPSEAVGGSPALPKSSSRRRLLQAGIGATPAILTIVSSPVLAGGCRSPSAFASVSAAAAAGTTTSATPSKTCSGLSPTTWNITNTWPSAVPKTTLFSSVFSGSYTLQVTKGAKVVSIPSPTFSEVLSSQSVGGIQTTTDLARNMVAAYLNFKDLKTPAAVVTDVQLQAMWTAVLAGSYRPIAVGNVWSISDANNWLKQTFN